MAEFAGVFTAPALSVAPCGLLSVANVVRHSREDEQWLRGFDAESNAYPTVRILTINNDTVTNGDITDGTGKDRFHPVFPFFIEVEANRTGFDLVANNPLDGSILRQIEAADQKAVEYELWEGVAARALTPTPGTGYLRQQTNGATLVTTSGQTPIRALALIEEAISLSPTGQRGIIHMTRDVASSLGDHLLYMANSREDESAYAVTRLGTLVVIGSGYTGNGPIGATGTAASATNKWMFATGGVEVHLGAPEIVNDSITQGFNSSTNDSIVLAQQPAAVHFDPSVWFAAQVTLS